MTTYENKLRREELYKSKTLLEENFWDIQEAESKRSI
jgi:hypothetical protein